MTLEEAREGHARAAAEHAAAAAEYGRIYMDLQHARSEHKHVRALELQEQLQGALSRRELAQQMVDGHSARLKVIERKALTELKRQLVREYAQQAKAIALQLSTLMVIDQKLGLADFDSVGIGGFRVPAYGDLKADDTGAIYAFGHLHTMFADAEKQIEAMLTKETEHA